MQFERSVRTLSQNSECVVVIFDCNNQFPEKRSEYVVTLLT